MSFAFFVSLSRLRDELFKFVKWEDEEPTLVIDIMEYYIADKFLLPGRKVKSSYKQDRQIST